MSLVWIHEDALTLDHPVMSAAGTDARPVFIWDTQEHDARRYSFKRRVFIFETVLEMGIPIYEGDPYDVLSRLAGTDETIFLAQTADPYTADILADLRDSHDVKIIDGPALTYVPQDTDMGRFFRFWNKAKKTALKTGQRQDA